MTHQEAAGTTGVWQLTFAILTLKFENFFLKIFFFKVIPTPSMGLQLMAPRSRVMVLPTDPQVPQKFETF